MAKQNDLDRAYLRMAYVIAELSQAERKKVGAVLVAAGGGIIAEGFNGTPAGFDNSCELLDECYVLRTRPEVLHAESNAIMKVARSTNSSAGSTLYTTLMPCFECSKLIIQAGIRRVVFSEFYPYKGFRGVERPIGNELLEKAKVLCEQLDLSCHYVEYDINLEPTEASAPEDLVP